jgi:uncharacterized membrane protein HdeD (DUF308 family)
MTTVLGRNWWALALRGLLAIVFGLIAFINPAAMVAAFVLLFGAYAIIDGIFAIVAGVRAAERHERWWPLALKGVIDIVAGIIVFRVPAAGVVALLFLVAFWALMTGVLEIVAAVRLRREIEGEWLLILSGILSLVFGIIVLARPEAALLVLVWWIGAYAIVSGVVLIVLAFKLRARHQAAPAATGAARPA